MKKSIFTLVFLAVIGWASAQSLRFELDGHAYGQGESIVCTQVDEGGSMVQEMQIRNLTSAPMNIMIRREIVKLVDGTENSFCWGNCFAPFVDVSPTPKTLEAGEVCDPADLSFHHQIDLTYSGDPANFVAGTSIAKYYAYPEGNEADYVCIEVWFAYNAEGVAEKPICNLGRAYPNPASSVVRFDYALSPVDNASVAVYNLLGQEVMRQPLTTLQGVATLSVADLNEGIYFCNLIVNGQSVQTEKFIVKK